MHEDSMAMGRIEANVSMLFIDEKLTNEFD